MQPLLIRQPNTKTNWKPTRSVQNQILNQKMVLRTHQLCKLLESDTREENRASYLNSSFRSHARNHGGIQQLLPMGTTSTSTHERVYKFVVPAEEEDNPRPLDLIGDYGLFPKSEVLVDLHNGSDNQREGSEHTTFPIKAELAFWVRMREVLG